MCREKVEIPGRGGGQVAPSGTSGGTGGLRGGGVGRPYIPSRGGARIATGDASMAGSTDESSSTPFGQRYAGRGRGGPPTARGGSTTASAFNSRAQGLYDPRDPKDRPRNRLRSTSDEGETTTADNGGNAWTSTGCKPAWVNNSKENNTNAWNKEPTWSRENSISSASVGTWKNENGGTMPEWMDDGDEGEKEESSDDAISGAGSFDEQGRFRQQGNVCNASPSKKTVENADDESGHLSFTSSNPLSNPWSSTTVTSDRTESSLPSNPSQIETSVNIGTQKLGTEATIAYSKTRGSTYVPPATQPVVIRSPLQFYYLDPSKQERGPFEKLQMDNWYKNGYFNEGLEVRRSVDTTYKTLGELMQINGHLTPFDYKDEVVVPPTSVYSATPSSFGALFGGASLWNEIGSSSSLIYGQPTFDPIAVERKVNRIEDEQRRMLEVKMREYQEHMMREMQRQREEHEKELRERQMALMKHQEEIARREREMHETAEEMKARLEMERIQLEEKARQIEADRVAKLEKERRIMEIEAARKAEEIRKEVRAKEEAARREKEEQERKKIEEADREKRAEEAAEREGKRLRAEAEAAAEKIRQHQAEAQRKQQLLDEEMRKRAAAAEREKQKHEASKFEIEQVWEPASKPKFTSSSTADDDSGWQTTTKKSTSKVAPWSANTVGVPREKTLKEIQEEEEKQMRAEQAEQARLKKEQQQESAMTLQSSGTWLNASQRIQWNQPQVTIVKSSVGKPAWGGAGVEPPKATTSPFWDGPSLQAANKIAQPVKKVTPKPIPTKNVSTKYAVANKSSWAATEETAKKALGISGPDPFISWVIQRVKQLSTTVDAEVLATFIESVENPDEVEDYVIGYLGDLKPVKEFVREFLHKRSDMRGRKGTTKDDLSSASGAPAAGTGLGGPAHQGKKKKNKGARLVVDGACLGFRATSDPNRVNQGEIETLGLMPGQKR